MRFPFERTNAKATDFRLVEGVPFGSIARVSIDWIDHPVVSTEIEHFTDA